MKNKIIHRNQWYWGNLSTIILHGGLAICDIEEDLNDPQKCWLMGVRTLDGHAQKGYVNSPLFPEMAVDCKAFLENYFKIDLTI